MSRIVVPPRRVLIAAVAALAVAIGVAGPAHAHAELVSAEPAINGSVTDAPERIILVFSEALDPDRVRIELLDVLGRQVTGLGTPAVDADNRTVTVPIADLATGVFTVSYEVVSLVDGHATRGTYAFLIDPTGAAPPPADSAESSSPSVDGLTIGARWIGLGGFLVALGSLVMWWNAGRGVLPRRGVDERPPWRLVAWGSALGAVGVVGYLLLAARPLPSTGIGLDPAAAFGWTPFAIAMRLAIACGLVAAVLANVGRRVAGPRRTVVVAALLGTALATMSVAGHAATAGGPGFAALDWLHLVAVAAWLGALPSAWALARRVDGARRDTLVELFRGHGRIALVAAPVVALSGIANSPLVLGSGRDLVASDYGNLLVAKAVLLSTAVGIGAVNHLALRGRGRAATAVLVTAELAVAALAVMAAATMVTIQPASARTPIQHAPPIAPAHFFEEIGPTRVHVAVSLPAPGTQSYRVTARDLVSGDPPADVEAVTLTLTPPPGAGAEARTVELEPDPAGGLWSTSGELTPTIGTWDLTLTIGRRDGPDDVAAFPLEVLALDAPETGPAPAIGMNVPAPLAIAWAWLPDGMAGWLPAVIGLVVLIALGRLRRSTVRDAARIGALAVVLVAGAGAASRTLVTAANAPTDVQLAAQPELRSPDIERGRDIYIANCAACHGPDGAGDGPISTLPAAGSLAAAVRSASDAELSYRIGYGVAGTAMPPFAGTLTVDERSDLIGYLRDRFGPR